MRPVYREFAALALGQAQTDDSATRQARLRRIQQALEVLKESELVDYLQDDCAVANDNAVQSVDPEAAILYPVLLDSHTELLVQVGDELPYIPEHQLRASGGLIGITPDAPGNGNDAKPEETRQKEIGVKSDWLDQRLTTTLTVYELELYNRRTRDPENPNNILLSGLQRSRGIELTATGNIAGNWYVRGGIGLQDAIIVKDNNGQEGNRINDVAKRNGSLFITWKPELGWYAETGLTLVGERYADNQNTTVLPGYGRWDALAGYRTHDWDVRAALSNIADKAYYSSATSAAQIMVGDPRSLVVTGSYSF